MSCARTLAYRLRMAVRIRAVASGPGEALRAIRAAASGRGDSDPGEPVGIGMKALHGEQIFIRPGTSDLSNAVAYYERSIFMPPAGIPTPSGSSSSGPTAASPSRRSASPTRRRSFSGSRRTRRTSRPRALNTAALR